MLQRIKQYGKIVTGSRKNGGLRSDSNNYLLDSIENKIIRVFSL